jgi:hypothetical protein
MGGITGDEEITPVMKSNFTGKSETSLRNKG